MKRRNPVLREKLGGVTITVQKCRRPGYAAIVTLHKDGERVRQKYCKETGDAKTLADTWIIEAGNNGARAAVAITDADKRLVMDARTKLEPYGKTLADALTFYVGHLERTKASIRIDQLVDRFLHTKEREKAGDRHMKDLRLRLQRFCVDYGEQTAASIESEDISQWLAKLGLSAQSLLNYRRVLYGLFAHALTLRAIDRNPVATALKPKTRRGSVGILTPEQALRILTEAAKEPEILSAVAIGLFAGVRDAELHRLQWSNVDLTSGYITVNAADAKTQRRRLIPIRPALAAWLGKAGEGSIWPTKQSRGRYLWEDVRRRAGFGKPGEETKDEKKNDVKLTPWPDNALRHSCASYHLAAFQDAPRLALELGNSVPIILEHYREIVLPTEAEKFWALRPGKSNIVA